MKKSVTKWNFAINLFHSRTAVLICVSLANSKQIICTALFIPEGHLW